MSIASKAFATRRLHRYNTNSHLALLVWMDRLQWSLNASTSALKEATTTSLLANASHAIRDADHALALQARNAHLATMATSSLL